MADPRPADTETVFEPTEADVTPRPLTTSDMIAEMVAKREGFRTLTFSISLTDYHKLLIYVVALKEYHGSYDDTDKPLSLTRSGLTLDEAVYALYTAAMDEFAKWVAAE